MSMADHSADLIIVGAGPAGLYAAYYAGFRGWSTIVLDNLPEPGGQITAMYPEKDIFDVAGFPSVRGRELVDALVAQAGAFQPQYLLGHQATGLAAPEGGPVRITTDTGLVVEGKACLITGGIGSFSPRSMPAGTGWEGKGLVYFVPRLEEHRDADIVIVGGGDSAFDWAAMLHPVARSIRIVHRREQFRAHGSMVEKVRSLGVPLHTPCEVTAVHGNGRIDSVDITSKTTGETETVKADTVIAALGFVANIGPMASWGLTLEKRHILVDTTMATSLPGVFAAGDIAVYPGKVALISVAFGEAALAVNNAAPIIDPGMGIFPGHSSGESN
jgi:thioredoxin reductase (NADPH)